MSAPVEVTTRFATTVDDIASAWAFVMARMDSVGPNPRIVISPVTIIPVADMYSGDEPDYARQFEVVVEGMVPEPATLFGAEDQEDET